MEENARALFMSWFIDFEGHDDCIGSELGPIPRGWDVSTLGDVLTQSRLKVGNRTEVTVLSAVSSGELVQSDYYFNKQLYSKNLEKYLLVPRYALAYNPSRINIGSVGLNDLDVTGAVSPVYVVAQTSLKLVWWLRFLLQTPGLKAAFKTLASGSVRQSLNFSEFASIPVIIPTEEWLDKFNNYYQIIRLLREVNSAHSDCLGEIRDTLQYNFLSGEVQVPTGA